MKVLKIVLLALLMAACNGKETKVIKYDSNSFGEKDKTVLYPDSFTSATTQYKEIK